MAIGLKFRIKVVEGLNYPYSENKGADQLRSYSAAGLRLCFRICKSRFSHNEAHISTGRSRPDRLKLHFESLIDGILATMLN